MEIYMDGVAKDSVDGLIGLAGKIDSEAVEHNSDIESFYIAIKQFQTCPNEQIKLLVRDLQRICENKILLCRHVPGMKQLSFAYLQNKDLSANACIVIPGGYTGMLNSNPIANLGGIVFVASQSRDYHNGRLTVFSTEQTKIVGDEVGNRARMWEAQYILEIVKIIPDYANYFNEYQKGLIEMFPQGIETKPELLYSTIEVQECQKK